MSLDESYQLVRKFHRAFNLPVREKPFLIPESQIHSRAQWIKEEVNELEEASTMAEQADALLDIIYLALGGFAEMGVRPERPFHIVHQANMLKLWSDGRPRYEQDGKISKPSNWADPVSLIVTELERQSKEAASIG